MIALTPLRILLGALDAGLRRLDGARSGLAIACAVLPVMVVLLFPAGFAENESQYLMLGLRRVSPELFSTWDAAFDHSDARIVSELVMGGFVRWLGYEGGQIALRVVMMALYAVALACLFSAIGLSVLESVLVLAVHGLVGPDLMGAEWLFLGVESKTFAYALVFVAFGLAFRARPGWAIAALVGATYMHFLVGGFWFVALMVLLALRTQSMRTLAKLTAIYLVAVLPLIVVLVVEQQAVDPAAPAAAGHLASYLFAIVRVPHHANPFANLYGLGFWLHGIIATVGLFLAFALLAGRVNQTLRPLVIWLAALLAYLLLAVVISAFDTRTGILGAFLPFRPSALILLFCVVALLLTVRSLALDESAALRDALIRCAFIALVPVFLWDGAKESVKALTLRPAYADLREVIGFIDSHAGPGDVVLTDPDVDMKPLGADLPRLISRPSLVSFKYVPNTPADIYRWWDLLEFRKKVYRGECPRAGDPPVRFVLYADRAPGEQPACGSVVFRSQHFAIAELPPPPG